MGTLFEQPERNYRRVDKADLDELLSHAAELSKKHSIPVAEVIAAHRVLELKRANDLRAADGDIFDEQIAGLGEVLQRIAAALETMGDTSLVPGD